LIGASVGQRYSALVSVTSFQTVSLSSLSSNASTGTVKPRLDVEFHPVELSSSSREKDPRPRAFLVLK